MKPSEIRTIHSLPKNSYMRYISMFPITQAPQVKTYTTLILTLLAVIGFSVFAISPTITTIVELRRKLADSEFANAALEEKIIALDALQTEYSTLGSTLERVNQAIPTTPDVPMLFARIQTLANNSGVEITSLQSQKVEVTKKSSPQPSSFVFSTTVSGSYQQTAAFLSSLTSFNRIITIDTITVDHSSEKNKQLIMTIRARAYFHPEPL